MRKAFCVIYLMGWSMLPGQTLGEAKVDFQHQEKALRAKFLEYMGHQAEVFAERTNDVKGDLTVAFTARLEKTQMAWLAWAELQASDQVAAEPVGKQEALLWIAKAWLYEQKSREFGSVVGGPENVNQPVIDDTRVNIGPIARGFDPYIGGVGGAKGTFALQWVDEKSVRGAFASESGMKTFRVFGESTEEGVIEFLFVVAGADEGIEVVIKRKRSGIRTYWEGSAEVLGDLWMEKVVMPEGKGELIRSDYEGRSGRSRLSMNLGWKPSGHVEGVWTDQRAGVPSPLHGLKYVEGFLYLDRWQGGGPGVEGATVPAMWFLKKAGTNPVNWTGTAIYLNGYEERLSFAK